jgi:uncharacterized membrane protein
MPDQENHRATPDEKIAHQAKAWRRFDKAAIADKCDSARRAEYHARQQLREAVDTLDKKDSAP